MQARVSQSQDGGNGAKERRVVVSSTTAPGKPGSFLLPDLGNCYTHVHLGIFNIVVHLCFIHFFCTYVVFYQNEVSFLKKGNRLIADWLYVKRELVN